MFLRILLSISIICLSIAQSVANNWEGTWETSFGQLKLVQIGNYVVGDYASVGVIIGERRGNQLIGVFIHTTNASSGRFTFVKERGKFKGAWHYENSDDIREWNGSYKSTVRPTLKNFSVDGQSFTATTNTRQDFNGVYKSPFGEIRLKMQDNILWGDYAKKGILVGVWNGNHYKGYFTNNGQVGWFKFYFFSANGSFRSGEWGWYGKEKSGNWTLTDKLATNPRIFQVAPKDAKTVTYMEEKLVSSSSSSSSSSNASNNQPKYTTVAAYKARLTPSLSFEPKLVSTLLGMQYHVKWISQKKETDVITALEEDGYKVEGDALITSKSDETLLKWWTSERLRAYVAVRRNDVVVCFRGSKASSTIETVINGIHTDADISVTKPFFLKNTSRYYSIGKNVKVHHGFNVAYNRLRAEINRALDKHKGKNIYIFGHSLGGAQATLCALDIAINRRSDFGKMTVIVSGTPRIGDHAFKTYFDKAVGTSLRLEIVGDPVPMIPPQKEMVVPGQTSGYKYKHVGNLLVFYQTGRIVLPKDIKKNPLKARMSQHANTNYFNVINEFARLARTNNFFRDKTLPTKSGNAERVLN